MIKATIFHSGLDPNLDPVAEIEVPMVPRVGETVFVEMEDRTIDGTVREIGWTFGPGELASVWIFLDP